MATWWLSFADDNGNRGCCIVRGSDLESAVRQATVAGCHPGGEVLGYAMPDSPDARAEIDRWGFDRLFTADDMLKSQGEYRHINGKPVRSEEK